MKTKLSKRALAVLVAVMVCLGILPFSALAADETTYSCVSPVGHSTIEAIEQAPRLDSLEGKTIAIVGRSFNATVTQAVLKEEILKDYPTCTVYTVNEAGCGGVFSVFHQSAQSKQFQAKLKELKVDAVISGNCGCGLCTVKESGSAIAAEYLGIPTVTVGATSFITEIHSTGVNRGVPVLRTAEYPGAFSSDSRAELQQKSRDIIYPLVVTALTTQITQEEVEEYARESVRNYDDILVSGPNDMLQEYYKQCGYTDGQPIGLPTKEKVETYLQYTDYEGSDVLGVYPLAYRECRVYTVAANAIMAGCPAEYMPFCIAFTKCLGDPEWRRTLASTHGWSPYAWLNGPVARQLGIDCGQGMLNETANKSLARFIEFAMMNLGGYYVKENRMGTFGYMAPWVFAEDDAACLSVGWQPYHVQQGYDLNDNTLTAASALAWGNNVTPATPDAEQTMKLMAWDITEKEQNGLGNTNPQVWRTVFVTESVAKNLSEGYKTKEDLDEALLANARRPLWLRVYANYWANTGSYQYTRRTLQEHYDMLAADEAEQAAVTPVPDWLKPLFPNDTEMMTVATMNRGQTPMLVCGDATRNKFQVMPGGGYATIKIELPHNWDELMAAKGYEPLSNFYLEEEEAVTGPVEAAPLNDGTWRALPAETQLTAQGRYYYDAKTGTLKYWAFGATAKAETTLEADSMLAKTLAGIGSSANITVKDGFITDYIIRPPATARTTELDMTALDADLFKGANLTYAVNLAQNSQAGGVTPTGTTIVADSTVKDFGLDLGGTLLQDAGNTEGFLTWDGTTYHLNENAASGSVAKVGAATEDGQYRTFTFTMGKGKYTIAYNNADTMNGATSIPVTTPETPDDPEPPVPDDPEPPVVECEHDWQWVTDREPTCEEDGQKHQQCTKCGEVKDTTSIAKLGHDYKWITDREPTCIMEGVKHEECARCGKQKAAVAIPMLDHQWGDWYATTEGHHARKCATCGGIVEAECTFKNGVCTVCGQKEKTPEPAASMKVTVKTSSSGFWFWTTYKADITATGTNCTVAKVEYSTNNSSWTTGTSYSSSSKITKLYIRVTDNKGNVTKWYYNGSTTVQQ